MVRAVGRGHFLTPRKWEKTSVKHQARSYPACLLQSSVPYVWRLPSMEPWFQAVRGSKGLQVQTRTHGQRRSKSSRVCSGRDGRSMTLPTSSRSIRSKKMSQRCSRNVSRSPQLPRLWGLSRALRFLSARALFLALPSGLSSGRGGVVQCHPRGHSRYHCGKMQMQHHFGCILWSRWKCHRIRADMRER